MAALSRPGGHPCGLPDWRNAGAYRFGMLDRAGFAWEWLRRDPSYRRAALAALGGEDRGAMHPAAPARWGLVRFEHPDLAVPLARPIWTAAADRSAQSADARPCMIGDPEGFALEALGAAAIVAASHSGEHLVVSDGWRRVRLDVQSGTLLAGPVVLDWHLSGLDRIARRIRELEKLTAALSLGRVGGRLWPRERRAHRWTLALRAHDALACGVGHREIAELIALHGARSPRWRERDPSLRSRAQRLVGLSRDLVGKGFADRFLSAERD